MPTPFPSRAAIRLSVLPKFPSRVVGDAGVRADLEGGIYTLSLDTESLVETAPGTSPSNLILAVFNTETDRYEQVDLTSALAPDILLTILEAAIPYMPTTKPATPGKFWKNGDATNGYALYISGTN